MFVLPPLNQLVYTSPLLAAKFELTTSSHGCSQWNWLAMSPQKPLGSSIERLYISSYSALSFR